MKIGIMLYRFGILGFLFAPGVLFEEPLKTLLAQNHGALATYVLLYGLPVLVGFTMLTMTEEGFRTPPPVIARLLNALSALTVFWLLLWWILWAGLPEKAGNQADLFVRYLSIVSLAGTAVGLGGYVWGWTAGNTARKTARFLMVIGWNVSFMSFLNLHLDPTMTQLKGPGFGGLLVLAGIYLISREL